MKCVYKFPVKWVVEVERVQPFTHNGWLYEFLLENGRVSHILVTVPLAASDKLPDFAPNPTEKNVIDISMNEPASSELMMKTLRTLEGVLAIYGFIDAIHDFYFLLETLFANGKAKNNQVMAEFTNSSTLLALSTQVLQEGEGSVYRRGKKNLLKIFRNKYANKKPAEYLRDIVKLRGFLHHHSMENKKIWDPSLEYEYEVDALLLQDLCFKVCVAKVEPLICTRRNPATNQAAQGK